MPTTLSPEQTQRIARALSDPTRFEVLRRIYASGETMNCGAAVCDLGISPATGSHHLHELEAAELIRVEKDGRQRLLTARRDVWGAYLAELNRV